MLDFIKDIFAAFRQNSLERMKSPFLGAFVFSWLGFNWQLLAILFISKKDIEERIFYINHHFGIESLLVGPLFTTTLICILLPQATKFIVKMQSKPISDATLTTMTEKIALAAKQLEIADIESKKRLSDKREERSIEEDIQAVKRENISLKKTIDEQDGNLKTLTTALNDASTQINAATIQMSTLSNQSEKLQKTVQEKDQVIVQLTDSNLDLERLASIKRDDLKAYSYIISTLRARLPILFDDSLPINSQVQIHEPTLVIFEKFAKSLPKRMN